MDHDLFYEYSASGVTWRCSCGAYAYAVPATQRQAYERSQRHLRKVRRLADQQLEFVPRLRAA